MKTLCFTLLLLSLALPAQTPPEGAAASKRAETRRDGRRIPTGDVTVPEDKAAAAGAAATGAATAVPPPRRPAPVLPAAAGTPAPAAATDAAPPATAPTTPPGLPGATEPAAAPVSPASAAAAPAAASPTAAETEELMPPGAINWSAAPIDQVLQIYADYVGRTILRPATLAAPTIYLKTQTPLTKTEIIQALNAVLAMNGIEMVNIGDKFVKAVVQAQAYGAGAAFGTNDSTTLPELGGFITHVVQLKYLKPSEMAPVITPFASVATAVLPIDTSMILVLRDHVENVKRMLEMIEKTDVTVPSEFISEVIPIKFAKAEEIASALGSLSGGGGGGTTMGARSGTTRTATPGATGMRPGMPGYNPAQPTQPMTTGAAAAGTPSSGASFSDRLQQIIRRASSSSGDLQILGTTKIIADARSNSLLIFAMRQDMEMIKDIITKLDVVLAQVVIETIIMDVSLDNTFALGISAVQTPRQFSGDFSGAGGMNLKRFTDIAGGGSTGGGTNAFTDLIGTGLRYFGKVNEDIYFQIEAAASDGKVNVIQKPRIQTSHATPAAIFIGNTVPYVTGTYYGGYGGGPGSTYQQLRVGIGLNVTPFINQDGLVVMQIDETIDEISGSTTIENIGAVPNTTSRTLSAEVAVRDGETILLGGFIRNSQTVTKAGVPILKDIPILGYLFRSTGDSKERKELMVLMRPTVLRTPELAAAHVAVEKEHLPGVRAAEAENDRMEQKINEQEKKRSLRRK